MLPKHQIPSKRVTYNQKSLGRKQKDTHCFLNSYEEVIFLAAILLLREDMDAI